MEVIFSLELPEIVGLKIAFFVGWRETIVNLSDPRLVVPCQPERILFRQKRGSFGLRGPCVGLRGLCVGLRWYRVSLRWLVVCLQWSCVSLRGPYVGLGRLLVGRKGLSVVFDLRFCDDLRASFVGLRDHSIGLRSPRFVVLCQPERTVFRSETRALFRPRKVSVGLKGFYVGKRGLCGGPINLFVGLRVPSFGLT